MLNPLFGRHTRVNRFSRGLIHYGGYFAMLCVYSSLALLPFWDWYWLFWQVFIVGACLRVWNFIGYNLLSQEIPFLWVFMSALMVILYVGIQVLSVFLMLWLPWNNLIHLFWQWPLFFIADYIFYEMAINIMHLILSKRIIEQGWQNKFVERILVNNVILTYLKSY